jgi:hypothetical protein
MSTPSYSEQGRRLQNGGLFLLFLLGMVGGCGSDTGSGDGDRDSESDEDFESSDTDRDTGVVGSGAASCDGLITDRETHPMSALAKPARLSAAIDPEFGTRIVRVTDVVAETGGEVIKPMYSTIQAWNADESYLVLYEVDGGHRLYDGKTYEFIRTLDINPADLEQVYLSPVDPDVIYYADGDALVSYSISKDTETVLHTFEGCGSVSAGEDPMYISWDGQSFGFLCENTGRAFVYHLDSDEESPGVETSYLGPQVAPSGNTVYLDGDVYDGDMNFLRTLDLYNPNEHASLGRRIDGHDTLNIVPYDPGPKGSGVGVLVVFDLQTGASEVIVGEDTGFPYPPSGTHISAVAHQAPGWTAVSIVGNDFDGQALLDNELLLADTNTGEVCRIAHHRSHGNDGPQGYWAEPHVSISPLGTRVVFGSDWGGGETVDTYVVELPSYLSQ